MIKIIFLTVGSLLMSISVTAQTAYIRINQAGYLPSDFKTAVVMAKTELPGEFTIKDAAGDRTVVQGRLKELSASDWRGNFAHYYAADFSSLNRPGRYVVEAGGTRSREFAVRLYPAYQEDLLFFMRQQRCGYNPFLDMVCHKR